MLRRVLGLTTIAALLPLAGLSAQDRAADLSKEVRKFVTVDAPVVALTGVRVVDGTGSEPRDGRTVLIREGRIAAVGPDGEIEIPEDAAVLDRRFVAAWEDADPELQNRVEEARHRLQQLTGSGPESDE